MLAIVSAVLLASTVPPPDLVAHMIERIRQDTANSRSMTYVQERTEYETFNGTDQLKKRETWSVRGTGTGFVQLPLSKNGKPVTGPKERPLPSSMIQVMAKYDFVPIDAAPVSINGYDCWQVAFRPKAGLRDGSEDDDAILNHIAGYAYVDAHNYLIRLIHADLAAPFRRGFLNAGHILGITLDAQQVEWDDQKHVGIQSSTVIRVHYKVLGDTYLRIEYLNTSHAWQP